MNKDLRTHMLQHDGKKSRSCNQCGYSTIKTADLKKTHAGSQWRETVYLKTVQLLLRKSLWPKDTHANTFRSETLCLQTVQLTHSGEKPFNCTQCNYSCTTASDLKKHMLTHSGEKPFSCTQCNYSYTRHKSWFPQDTHVHPFRREAFQVWAV